MNDKTIFRSPKPGRRKQPVTSASPTLEPAAIKAPGLTGQPVNADYSPRSLSSPSAVSMPASASYSSSASVPPAADWLNRPLSNSPSSQAVLLKLAEPLLLVLQRIQGTIKHPDPQSLHRQLVQTIKQFEAQTHAQNINNQTIMTARYVLCTALDEAVLNTPWGNQSGWQQHTLLRLFHNETGGGEKFFQLLSRLLQKPHENRELLELFYILLSLGYAGKYRLVANGQDRIHFIRDEVFSSIRQYREEPQQDLSPHWQGIGQHTNRRTNSVPVWVVASLFGVVLLLGYTGFRYAMHEQANTVITPLQKISAERELR